MSGTQVATADWTVLDQPYVRDIAQQAARRVFKKYEKYSELADLEQEALVFLATKKDLREVVDNPGLLQYRLEADLVNHVQPDIKRVDKQLSYDALVDQAEDGETFIAPYVIIETASNDYSRESVESLLPAIWDESYLYGLPQKDTVPDPDMPKGYSNKSHGNNLSAYIADIKEGWAKTPLTQKERVALFLAYSGVTCKCPCPRQGRPWTHDEIAYNQDCHRTTITHRIETAIGKIVARLNGGYWYELEGIEP